MQDMLKVHLHEGDPCPRCGDVIEKIRVAQRGTYLCRHASRPSDRRPGVLSGTGATRPSRRAAP